MMEQLKQIAERIRGLREIAGVSAESLAEELKIPLDKYNDYENGSSDIPVSLLYQIAGKFHVELTAILTGIDPRLHVYSVVHKDKGASVDRRKEYRYQSLGFNFAHKKAEPFLVTVEPEAAETPFSLNAHPGQEFDYVLEGTLRIIVDNHEITLEAGDSIFYDSGYEHGMKAADNKPVKFLAIVL